MDIPRISGACANAPQRIKDLSLSRMNRVQLISQEIRNAARAAEYFFVQFSGLQI
jgi:hypothetical protein